MSNNQISKTVAALREVQARAARRFGNSPQMEELNRRIEARISRIRGGDSRSNDAVANALSNGDMFYVQPGGKLFRVCRDHQPDPSDLNDSLDWDAISDCDNCAQVDPISGLDLPDTDDPDADNPDNDDEGDDDVVV